jgi:16S rRNA A1518/A1519 N6-dimethyltransferase RsmA/KsgA/DIM1 with predicted DNA glycosylase/AP lyase activity
MRARELTSTQDGQFYPTPPDVARKMLEGVDFRMVRTVLEPSAGKGDLVMELARSVPQHAYTMDVDCCEIDPQLRQILKYQFSDEHRKQLMRSDGRFDPDASALERVDVHVVHDDFLMYRTYKHYDLILMNPPFAAGAKHLLRAIEMQKDGGSIVCLLNAETLRNPCTMERKLLSRQLEKYHADAEIIGNAFANAERPAGVDVAIVKIHFEQVKENSAIWDRMRKAVEEDMDEPDVELRALVPGDYIEQAIALYRTECAATMAFVREYRALKPFIGRRLNAKDSFDASPILTLTVTDDNYLKGFDYRKYMRAVRLKYWQALFENPAFTGRLTSEMQKKYGERIERMADYEFSAFNIKQIAAEMNASIMEGVEKAINGLFDKLTFEHAWYPECSSNRHYYNGWASNKAHKIGAKCIIPTSGIFSSYSWKKEAFDVSTAFHVVSDIEKAFNYLDGGRTEDVDLRERLHAAAAAGQTRNIECKYFKIDLFKKGTTHIKFLPSAMPLVERLNIYAARGRGWLPPNYGKAAYDRMSATEKAVVDGLHGDGTARSGEKQYATVLKDAGFYLSDPARSLPALTAGA